MPHQARLDALGARHNLILRGLPKADRGGCGRREAFVARLGEIATATKFSRCVWALAVARAKRPHLP